MSAALTRSCAPEPLVLVVLATPADFTPPSREPTTVYLTCSQNANEHLTSQQIKIKDAACGSVRDLIKHRRCASEAAAAVCTSSRCGVAGGNVAAVSQMPHSGPARFVRAAAGECRPATAVVAPTVVTRWHPTPPVASLHDGTGRSSWKKAQLKIKTACIYIVGLTYFLQFYIICY